MAGLATVATNTPLVKRIYGSKVGETTYKRDALLELCKKDQNFRGEDRAVVVAIAGVAGGSADFSAALEAQNATVERRFIVTRRKEYQVYSIDNEAIEASKGNQAAIVEILKRQVGTAKDKFDEALARRVHGTGNIGRLPASINSASTSFTLLDRMDVVGLWQVNTLIDFKDTDGTSSPTTVRAGGPLKVTAVNRMTGAITVNAVLSTISGITASDFIFRKGDYGNAMIGLQGWIPIADPSSTAFNGVDRTEDLARLSGLRIDGAGKPKEETLQDAGAECQINGITPKHVLVNSLDFKDVGKELGGSKIQEGGTGITGFSKIICYIATGAVEIRSSPFVKRGYFWMGDASSNFTLGTAGECPKDLLNGLMDSPTGDSKQGRLGCYGNPWVDNPGDWLVGKW